MRALASVAAALALLAGPAAAGDPPPAPLAVGVLERDLPRLVDFYLRGLLDLDTIIAERIPLEAVNEGFNTMRAGRSARSVVVFD